MKILVKIFNDRQITLEVEPTNSVEEVKAMIEENVGFPQYDQRLIFNGMQIEDGETLQYYSVQDGSTIILVKILRG